MTLEGLINIFILTLLAVTALAIARLRSLFPVAMLTGMYSLLTASLFVLLDAVDVALTEAAVGAGAVTILLIGVLALTRSREKPVPARRMLLALPIVLITGGALILATLDMPHHGKADNPVHTHPIQQRYLQDSREEIGIPNAVTSVLASYRGFDTLGEITVIFTAGVGVLMLLSGSLRRRR